MAPITPIADFKKILQSEFELVRQFVTVLEREQDNLSQGKIDRLADFAEQKGALAAKLNELAEKRVELLCKQGFSCDKQGIESWCSKNSEMQDVPKLWSDILALAAEARELNRLNGDLIRIHMQHNSKALEILLGSNRSSLPLYGPDGQSTSTESRRINDAA